MCFDEATTDHLIHEADGVAVQRLSARIFNVSQKNCCHNKSQTFSLEPLGLLLVVGEQARDFQRRIADLLDDTARLLKVQVIAQQPENLLQPGRPRARKRAQKNVVGSNLKVAHLLAYLAKTLRQNAAVTSIEKVILDVKRPIKNGRVAVLR